MSFDVDAIRAQFPGLQATAHGKPLVYLDSAASGQICKPALDAVNDFQLKHRANIHRGVHALSQEATELYDQARNTAAEFLGGVDPHEVIFTRGTTEAINLVAATWGRANLSEGDEIVLTELEHHSNIVPWQMVAAATGAVIRVIRIDERGQLDMDSARSVIGPNTQLVAFNHVANAIGTVNPVKELVALAKSFNATVLVDGAQGAPHTRLNMAELGCDFYVFSGHKVYGPTGIGVLWGRKELLDAMPPYQGGGDMIDHVSFEETTWNVVPHKFEAGTPNISGAIGLGAALRFLMDVGLDEIAAWEHELLAYAQDTLGQIPGLREVGTAEHKASVFSFLVDGVHPTDIGTFVDTKGVAVRTGHHCAQPLMERMGVTGTARASFALYNTKVEVDALAAAIQKAIQLFG